MPPQACEHCGGVRDKSLNCLPPQQAVSGLTVWFYVLIAVMPVVYLCIEIQSSLLVKIGSHTLDCIEDCIYLVLGFGSLVLGFWISFALAAALTCLTVYSCYAGLLQLIATYKTCADARKKKRIRLSEISRHLISLINAMLCLALGAVPAFLADANLVYGAWMGNLPHRFEKAVIQGHGPETEDTEDNQ